MVGAMFSLTNRTTDICGSRAGTGGPVPPPLPEKSQNIGFPSNIDLDPLKITKLQSQHSMVGHYRRASETPFRGPMLANV